MQEDGKLREKLLGRAPTPQRMSHRRMLWVKTLRASIPRGQIRAIKIPQNLPDDVQILTHRKLPGKNRLETPWGTLPLLAEKRVRYKGEAIALVVGRRESVIDAVMEQVEVCYDPSEIQSPSAAEGEGDENASSAASATKRTPIVERTISWGESEKIFSNSASILRKNLSICPKFPPSTAPLAVYCHQERGSLVLHANTTCPSLLAQSIAKTLREDREQVEVRFYNLGESLDAGGWVSTLMGCHTALVCRLTRAPVKMVYTADEMKLFFDRSTTAKICHQVALSKSGAVEAMSAEISLEVGAYSLFSKEILDRVCLGAAGLYRCPHLSITARAYLSEGPPRSPLRGWGLSEGLFFSESLANAISHACGENPVRWRLAHLSEATRNYAKERNPFQQLLKQVADDSDFNRKHTAYRMEQEQRSSDDYQSQKVRGIGLALSYHGHGPLNRLKGWRQIPVSVRLEESEKASVFVGVIPMTITEPNIWRRMVANLLEIQSEDVRLTYESRIVGFESFSHSSIAVPWLLQRCCEKIRERRFRDPLPIEESLDKWQSGRGATALTKPFGQAFPSLSVGACVVEVFGDRITKSLWIHHVWLALDCGLVDSKPIVANAVEVALSQIFYSMNSLGFPWRLEEIRDETPFFPPYTLFCLESRERGQKAVKDLLMGAVAPACVEAARQALGAIS